MFLSPHCRKGVRNSWACGEPGQALRGVMSLFLKILSGPSAASYARKISLIRNSERIPCRLPPGIFNLYKIINALGGDPKNSAAGADEIFSPDQKVGGCEKLFLKIEHG